MPNLGQVWVYFLQLLDHFILLATIDPERRTSARQPTWRASTTWPTSTTRPACAWSPATAGSGESDDNDSDDDSDSDDDFAGGPSTPVTPSASPYQVIVYTSEHLTSLTSSWTQETRAR